MRKATFVATLAAAFGLTGAALADGMYSKPAVSYKDAPIVVSGPVWTGFYVGAGIGAGAVVHDLNVSVRDFGYGDGYGDEGDYGDFVPLSRESNGLGGGNLLSFDGIGGEGAFGTLQIGYDKLIKDRVILGAFLDYDFSDIETEIRLGSEGVDIQLEDMWSVGVRLGYLLNPHTMLYGLLAYTEASFDAGDLGRVLKIDDFEGYSVGAGLETNLHGNWFLKGEYRFTQLDEENILPDLAGFIDVDLEPSIHTARVVLTYKFGRDGYVAPLK